MYGLLELCSQLSHVNIVTQCYISGLPDSYLCNSVCEEWLRTSAAFLLWDTLKVLTVHRNKVQLKWDGLFSRWGNFVLEAQYVDNAISMQLLGQASESAVRRYSVGDMHCAFA